MKAYIQQIVGDLSAPSVVYAVGYSGFNFLCEVGNKFARQERKGIVLGLKS